MTETDSRYYMAHLAELGESEEIRATEDIHNEHGVKLLAKGSKIGRKMKNILVRQKLSKPLDRSIAMEGLLTPAELQNLAQQVFENSPNLYPLLSAAGECRSMVGALRELYWEPALTNKLTVMWKCLPARFEHTLQVTLACICLGRLCRLSAAEQALLVNIGIYHDIGTLHIDPALFDSTRVLDTAQWQQINAHPLIGFHILRHLPGFHPQVSLPVLEHHERMDGSGYPRACLGTELSRLGRIVAVADAAVGICHSNPCEHLMTVIKANIYQFDAQVVETLSHALYQTNLVDLWQRADLGGIEPSPDECRQVERMAAAVVAIFAGWNGASEASALETRLTTRLDAIRQSLCRAGIAPENIEELAQRFRRDGGALSEISSLLRESLYRLGHIVYEVELRYAASPAQTPELAAWIDIAKRNLTYVQPERRDPE